jgi:hypothetical protein
MSKIKKTFLIIIFICGLYLTLFIIGEVSLRIYHKFKRSIPFSESLMDYYYDKELGWKGKLVSGDPLTKRVKIFVIGDSFTDGDSVRKENMYYNEIGKYFDAELFIYGGGGYGTLQEYIVVDKYFDAIKPDLLILQTCHNDFINNLWELQSKSLLNDDLMIRPYLIDGIVKYIPPRHLGRIALLVDSRLLYFLNYRIERLLGKLAHRGLLKTIESDIQKQGMSFSSFKKSVVVTDTLIAKMKARIGNTPMVAFCIDDSQPYIEQFRLIFKKNNVLFIGGVPEAVRQAQSSGIKVRLEDGGHLNENGNKICGDFLVKELGKYTDILFKKNPHHDDS